ncbi:hypothetical protein, partial [Falsiroseomonas oryzae]|uniref:hypothetical protein n=1 Tax=Falsiroseomonas oryzae TaxID=2766473 RepID=UPI0022EAC7BD
IAALAQHLPADEAAAWLAPLPALLRRTDDREQRGFAAAVLGALPRIPAELAQTALEQAEADAAADPVMAAAIPALMTFSPHLTQREARLLLDPTLAAVAQLPAPDAAPLLRAALAINPRLDPRRAEALAAQAMQEIEDRPKRDANDALVPTLLALSPHRGAEARLESARRARAMLAEANGEPDNLALLLAPDAGAANLAELARGIAALAEEDGRDGAPAMASLLAYLEGEPFARLALAVLRCLPALPRPALLAALAAAEGRLGDVLGLRPA